MKPLRFEDVSGVSEMVAHDYGDWVRCEDYVKLEDRAAKLQSDNECLRKAVLRLGKCGRDAFREGCARGLGKCWSMSYEWDTSRTKTEVDKVFSGL